jgi:hypothetical protein
MAADSKQILIINPYGSGSYKKNFIQLLFSTNNLINPMIRELKNIPLLMILTLGSLQAQQGFFLDTWKPKIIQIPEHIEAVKPSQGINLSLTIDAGDTITKIPLYVFGDNANAYTGSMSDNKKLMGYITDRKMGVLRGPSGSISDVFFWNRSHYQVPADVPDTLMAGGSGTGWQWWGKRPDPWEAGWTMDIDSFYSILNQADVTGLLTVNYGYARYGTSDDPVAQAAHMAADWVRYDNGRTKFWEIGNEVFGSWEAGYRIDTSLNKDGQPEYINGTLYGQHCRVYIDSMKAAASESGAEIFIGAVIEPSDNNTWNEKVMAEVGDIIDFYIIHSYYTPWQQNSTVDIILNSPFNTQEYMNFVRSCVDSAEVPMRPVALTEYNIFAIGSKQQVSQINGMHAVMVTGEVIKNKLGAACRWDLANGYSNGDDHGMYSYNEPGVEKYAPRPAFYYLYYMQKYLGDVLLKTNIKGSENMVAYSSSFSSGHLSSILVNKGPDQFIARINPGNITVGDHYYTYTLIGGEDIPADPTRPFSRKVIVNGTGPSVEAGGPSVYDTIRARSYETGEEILIETPPYSVTYVLIDTGNVRLEINTRISPPPITWNNPAEIIYGTPLTSKQLNASESIPGVFIYTPPQSTILNAGTGIPLTVTFIPDDTTTYTEATKTININVRKAYPVVTWYSPTAITYGTPLSDVQLNATANVEGTFTYDPPAGTILPVGDGQELNLLFSPDDSINYGPAINMVRINVTAPNSAHAPLASDLKIFPVPVTDVLSVDWSILKVHGQEITVSIQNTDGRTIKSLSTLSSMNPLNISVQDLPAGIYVLHLQTKKEIFTERFVKQ